ncbi:MAG: helix-turn-helix transcriptional regulator [Tannerellaceae bacterium]|nr:helix-turn-helix transcriptional regulator [Tannerellaceae bacterium]
MIFVASFCTTVTIRRFNMIVFDRLWVTLKKAGISQYKLIKEYGVSTGQLDRLRKNGNVSTYTLNQLCNIIGCSLDEIAEYKPDEM